MASASFTRLMLRIGLPLLMALWASAQSASPSNVTAASNSSVQFVMTTTLSNMALSINVNPLTDQAGLTGSPGQLQQISFRGPLVLTTYNTVNSLQTGDVAYISCEPSDYPGLINFQKTINLAVTVKPVAVVLYSIYATMCNFTATQDFAFLELYTMIDANSSSVVVSGLNNRNPPFPDTYIHLNSNNATSQNSGSVQGKSPTTAVAMIILYSITGIITALFLIIIIVGAIRAHRHPERYGPRRTVGRPRQSRAKGIARAMLETIPIVQFGDTEDQKPAQQGGDIELASPSAVHQETIATGSTHTSENAAVSKPEGAVSDGSDVVRTEAATGSVQPAQGAVDTGDPNVDSGLACSVCTDDFVKGQDIRVLPCKHKFHPECIDPWLLNVSGTCPLCRIDLHPVPDPTEDPDADGETPEDSTADTTSPANAPTDTINNTEINRRNRRSRILHTLNVGRMRHATPEQRIEALRRLRTEHQAHDPNADSGGWMVGERTFSRINQRLSRGFRSRPASGAVDRSRPASGVPRSAAASRPVSIVSNGAAASMPVSSVPATTPASEHASGASATTNASISVSDVPTTTAEVPAMDAVPESAPAERRPDSSAGPPQQSAS